MYYLGIFLYNLMVGCNQNKPEFHEQLEVINIHTNWKVRVLAGVHKEDFSSRNSYNKLDKILSKVLPIMGSNETGL